MDKLFSYIFLEGIIRVDTMAGETLYIPPMDLWMYEFWALYYDLIVMDQYETDRINEGDIVIDCGAHCGMFSHLANKRGAKTIYAFEPFKLNIVCLEKLLQFGYPINIIPTAVSDNNGFLNFRPNEQRSGSGKIEEEGYEVLCVTIDSIVKEFDIPRVDFIKMDIEGHEYQAIDGARETIAKFKPKLGISAYHNPDDHKVFRELLLSINPKYDIKVYRKNAITELVLIAS
jgi:FkbM family methyltransferase